MSLRSHLLFAMLAGVAAACTSIPLTSLPRLQGLDPLTMNPADIEVAVRLEDGLALEEDAVTLNFAFTNKVTDERLGGTFPLEPLDEPLTPFLERQAGAGDTVLRFRLSDDQAAELREAREQAMNWGPESEGQRSLSFATDAKPCMTEDANPFRALRFSIYLRDTPEKDYFTVINNRRLDFDEDTFEIKRCGAEDPAADDS